MMVVRPGEIALVVADDGAPIPSERILGKEVDCDSFQDAAAFLASGGERGRQLAFLTAGTYRINPALFQVVTTATAEAHGMDPELLRVYEVPPDRVGIVTALDGRPIPAGDLAGPMVLGHDSFQRGQAFIDAGGCRGLQEQVLLSGSWNLNPWFVQVEQIPMTEIPIGYVGVVVSYVGKEHLDLSGDDFTHGDLVEKGRKGVWVEPLLPGKHPLNTRVMKVELVPTTNIVLNWAQPHGERTSYDEKLSPITVRSQDGFCFSLDVSQIIHIGMKNAPRVISRVGSMQNLVDHVLQPTVANYFRNSAQEVTVLEFLSARSERQRQAYRDIRTAIEAYDVECIDTLIGDIVPPAELMKTQTDRKIADELQRTYDVQRDAQMKRQELERETAIANMQGEVVRSEQMVRITERNALASAESGQGRGGGDAAADGGGGGRNAAQGDGGGGRPAQARRGGGGLDADEGRCRSPVDARRGRRQGRGVPAGQGLARLGGVCRHAARHHPGPAQREAGARHRGGRRRRWRFRPGQRAHRQDAGGDGSEAEAVARPTQPWPARPGRARAASPRTRRGRTGAARARRPARSRAIALAMGSPVASSK